jgi:hypothetical protein
MRTEERRKNMKRLTIALIADIIWALLYTLFVAGVGFNPSSFALTTYPWVGVQDIVIAFVSSASLFLIPLLIWVWWAAKETIRSDRVGNKETIMANVGCPFKNNRGECVPPGENSGPICSFQGWDYERLCAVYPVHEAKKTGKRISLRELVEEQDRRVLLSQLREPKK